MDGFVGVIIVCIDMAGWDDRCWGFAGDYC